MTRSTHRWTAQEERRITREVHKSQVVEREHKKEEEKKTYKQIVLEYKQTHGSHGAGEERFKGKKIVKTPLVVRENEEDTPSAGVKGQ